MRSNESQQMRRQGVEVALRLLARREHSEFELRQKLSARGFDTDTIDTTLAECRRQNLVSDQRFVEAFAHQRRQRGYGPLRIRADLRQRGIGDELADRYVAMDSADWLDRLREIRRRKFGDQPPGNYREWTRQARFLQSRGFSVEQIRQVMGGCES